jgi:hypothetical protein
MDEIRVIIEERRVSPRPAFISDLVNARDAGDKLNDRELFDQIFGIRAKGRELAASARGARSLEDDKKTWEAVPGLLSLAVKFGFPETETAAGRDRFDKRITARRGPASGAGAAIRVAGRKVARGPSREAVCLQSPP